MAYAAAYSTLGYIDERIVSPTVAKSAALANRLFSFRMEASHCLSTLSDRSWMTTRRLTSPVPDMTRRMSLLSKAT